MSSARELIVTTNAQAIADEVLPLCNRISSLEATNAELLDALTDLVGGCGKEGNILSTDALHKACAAVAKHAAWEE